MAEPERPERVEALRKRQALGSLIESFEGRVPPADAPSFLGLWRVGEYELSLNVLLAVLLTNHVAISNASYERICELWDQIDVAGFMEEEYIDPRSPEFRTLIA